MGTTGDATAEVPSTLGRDAPSPRDVDAQRGLNRELKQRSLGGSGGWRRAEVKRVVIRGSEVGIETSFGPRRRDAAASLCIAARRFFLKQGQGQVQTVYNITVVGRDGGALARC